MHKLIFACAVLCFSACFSSSRQQPNNQTNETPKSANSEVKAEDGGSAAKKEEKSEPKIDCTKIDTGNKKLLKKQTFPMDFPPFERSCFVTSHDAEYTDPPLGSEFAVYKDGKKIFDFPEQLAGATCWVEAVAFEDLNGDNLKDVTIVGLCGAKSGDYNENRVYANTGKAFTTDSGANLELDNFSKIKEINDFVRKNKKLFFH